MQRVDLVRALANNPRLILADEPTGNLDTKSGDEILAIFENLWKQGHTVVVIIQNPNISARAQRIVELIDGTIENNNMTTPKVYEVDPLVCPKWDGQMRIIAFFTDFSVVDRIINHLKLSFVAAKPPRPRIASQELLVAAETSCEYFS